MFLSDLGRTGSKPGQNPDISEKPPGQGPKKRTCPGDPDGWVWESYIHLFPSPFPQFIYPTDCQGDHLIHRCYISKTSNFKVLWLSGSVNLNHLFSHLNPYSHCHSASLN